MALPGREISVGWALFLWDGRIGRRIFILGTLFWMMTNAAVLAFVTGQSDEQVAPGFLSLFLASASLSLLSLLMLGAKRLHDIGMPGVVAACASARLPRPPFASPSRAAPSAIAPELTTITCAPATSAATPATTSFF